MQTLNYIDDENRRRVISRQLNRSELWKRYREGQQDQLSGLGLVVNIIVLLNMICIDAALEQLRQEGFLVRDEAVARMSPFIRERHINLLGRYPPLEVPEAVTRVERRLLRNPNMHNA